MNITKECIIGELVANDYRTASVFKKNEIDFCCQGNRTIEAACKDKNIDAETLVQELINAGEHVQTTTPDFKTWPLDLLADYIEKTHHRYVTAKSAEIIPYLDKITRVHGGHHPELQTVNDLFKESVSELASHMKKEELILFPFIRKMVQANQEGTSVSAGFGTVQNPISMMMHEHDTEGERFRKIASLTNNYITPADGCNTYAVTLAMIKDFEDDLHLHIHLENNILFPKAVELEDALQTV